MTSISIHDFKQKYVVQIKDIKTEFNLYRTINVDAGHHTGCFNCDDALNQEYLRSEPWTGIQSCNVCKSLNVIYYSDRMGGTYTDTIEIYKEKI